MERETHVELRSRLLRTAAHRHQLQTSVPYRCGQKSLVEGSIEVNAYGIHGELNGRTPLGGIKHPFSLKPANANGVLSKEGIIPSGFDRLSGSGPHGIHTTSGKLDSHCVIDPDEPTQVCHEKFTIDTNVECEW